MKILADSNIWIDFFNHPRSKTGNQLESFLREEEVFVTGLILAELLQGATTPKEMDIIIGMREEFPSLEITEEIWIHSGKVSNQLRRRGVVLPLSDILLASLALANDCIVFTRDNHFKQIPGVKIIS